MSLTLPPPTIEWIGDLDGYVELIDQTLLPGRLVKLQIRDIEALWQAIKTLQVRGAPAIGIAAAMGAVLGVRGFAGHERSAFFQRLGEASEYLASSRPTAVNLVWALNRMRNRAVRETGMSVADLKAALLDEAKLIRDEDEAMCRAIGRHGEPLIQNGAGILTHCNAGSLATARFGTASAPMYAAHEKGRRFRVFVDETRPLLQGSRLTAWELGQAGIEAVLICDSMAGSVMQSGRINLVITGADRIAANGDVANKIGTYSLAVLAKAHSIPFYVAAPSSTFDLAIPDGTRIPIEERNADEVRCGFGRDTAPPEIQCFNPAFDVTPAALVRGIITERGMVSPVTPESICRTLADRSS